MQISGTIKCGFQWENRSPAYEIPDVSNQMRLWTLMDSPQLGFDQLTKDTYEFNENKSQSNTVFKNEVIYNSHSRKFINDEYV